MIGQLVSHYRITEKLGEGGMGVVYKAKDEQLGRWVAIKCLPPHLTRDEGRRARFLHEARTVSALNHPNIVIIHDLLRDSTGDYMIMECVEGRTLDRATPRGGMAASEMLALAVQIADALVAAHGAAIIHRDLKPGNVMVTPAGRVKVLDFGLAKLTEPQSLPADEATLTAPPPSQDGAVAGTISYMSPEQASGKALDSRSDVFSFGLLLYEMVSGQRAFQRATAPETMAAIIREEPQPIAGIGKDVPVEIERLIRRCLRKDPARRWQTMTDLKLTIEELQADSDSGRLSGVRPAAPLQPSRRWTWTAGLAAALVLILGAVWIFRGREEPKPTTYSPVPLTTDPGFETHAVLSPDGNQVAFVWAPQGGNEDIYVKLIGAGTPLRLTSNPAREGGPAWSPDGKWIVFSRWVNAKEHHMIAIPALGGPERRIAVLTSQQLPSFSPDGQWLSASVCERRNSCRIGLVPFEGGTIRTLTYPSEGRDIGPRFSPDGRYLVFPRHFDARISSIWVLPLAKDYSAAGEPRELTDRRTNDRPTWASNDSIVYTGGVSQKLFRVPLKGGASEYLSWAGIGAGYPAVSPRANRLVYTRRLTEYNTYSLSLGADGKAVGPPTRILDSTRSEFCPAYSPDGTRIAFESDRSGDSEIWVCDASGGNCGQLTSFGQFAGSPAWSPDGQTIAFDATVDGVAGVYLIPASGGKPRLISRRQGIVPRWSRDGKSIYYWASGGGIVRIPRDAGDAVEVARSGSVIMESPDGAFLYYSAHPGAGRTTLRRMRLADGSTEDVLPDLSGRNFVVTEKGIWFISTPTEDRSGYEIRYLDLATRAQRAVWRLEKEPFAGLDLTPDGRNLVFVQLDQNGADLMLVEGFR